MNTQNLFEYIGANEYPGRGIVLGRSSCGKKAVMAYFIMGRSENSRNRVFTAKNAGIITQAADEAKLQDPSLIIYAPVRVLGNATIVTNGDQTDTVYDHFKNGKGFAKALRTREFEPDAPNFTPRISGVVKVNGGEMKYKLSILKSANGDSSMCERYFYEYETALAGVGHAIHTYKCDGNPIPSFEGEPVRVAINDDIDEFADKLWGSLNCDNKVSLFVRFLDLETEEFDTRIINKYNKV